MSEMTHKRWTQADRNGAAMLPLMTGLSLAIVATIVLLTVVQTSWMLAGAAIIEIAAIGVGVAWLISLMSDEQRPPS